MRQACEQLGLPVTAYRCAMILAHTECACSPSQLNIETTVFHAPQSLGEQRQACALAHVLHAVIRPGATGDIACVQVHRPDQPDGLLHAPAGRAVLHRAGAGQLLRGSQQRRRPLRRHVSA